MIHFKPLQTIKLSALTLLDLAYVVVLLPLVLLLKIPMLVFFIIAIGLILFLGTPLPRWGTLLLFLGGLFALYLSLYGAFSLSGFSRLKLFLELLIYILLIVVTMQRLTREINFYLLISPFLFLALSLFFYHGMMMLGYVVFEIFFLLLMILSHRMDGCIKEAFATSMVMFMHALPWVVVLFIFFPRISFEHADYGFKGETTKRMGHDGTMYLDNNALLVPSEQIVMEVGFEKEVPTDNHLYFRGSILYIDKKDHWEGLPSFMKRKTQSYYPIQGEEIAYKVTLYPTQKKWLYMLDMPRFAIENSTLDSDLITTLKQKIDAPMHYSATSSLAHTYKQNLDPLTYRASTKFDTNQNPKTLKEAQKIKQRFSDISKRAKAIIDFFRTQSLTYTLKPKALDTAHATDSFLFDTRNGYCVHFSSSFVSMARMAGIPARIVTGYKGDSSESLKNYLAIKEKNAHAWAELYIENRWVRYETTTMATNIQTQQQTLTQTTQEQKAQNPWLKKINLYLMYTKYQVETWILYYSHIRQLQLLDYAKNNPLFVALFIGGILVLILISFLLVGYFKRPLYTNEALGVMQPLLKKLAKEGVIRKEDESLHQYLLRYAQTTPYPDQLFMIDSLYQEITYGEKKDKNSLNQLKVEVKQFISKKKG